MCPTLFKCISIASLLVGVTGFVAIGQEYDINQCLQKLLANKDDKRVLYFHDTKVSYNVHTNNLETVTFNNVSKIKDLKTRRNYYILTLKSYKVLKKLTQVLYNSTSFQSYMKTIVIFLSRRIDIPKIFRILWTVHLSNSVLITNTADIWTYHPISKGQCQDTTPTFITSCNQYLTNETTEITLFRESLSETFKNCKFKMLGYSIQPYVFPGPFENNSGHEIKILDEIVKMMKVDYDYISDLYSDWGEILPNGTYTKMYKELHDKQVDCIFGAMAFENEYLTEFSYIYPYTNIELFFYAPMAKEIAPWKNIFKIFHLNLNIAVIAAVLIVALSFTITSPGTNYTDALFFSFGLLVTACSYWNNNRFRTKLVYASWIFSVFILITSYQSLLMTFLFKRAHLKQIKTLEDLVESGIDIGGFKNGVRYFDSNDTIIQAIRTRWMNCSLGGEECLNRLYIDKDFGYWKNSRTLNYLMQTNKSYKAYRIPERNVFMTTMYLQRGSPFLERMNKIVTKMILNGMIAKLDKHVSYKMLNPIEAKYQPIKLIELYGVCGIWIIGMLLSMLIFLVEYGFVYFLRK